MTTRLYYTDPYLATFSAMVKACEESDGRWTVLLDRTAFYPTSGGQPFDTGMLGAARVLDVVDRDDEGIAHLVDAPLPIGAEVEGTIDWRRRFDHMQQHTAQHVLSAACDRLLGARTESFHLGAAASTIDLDREVAPADLARSEDDANRIVWEDRPVAIRFMSAEDAASLALRKVPTRTGTLRVIDVEAFDVSACGGTHVARTGAVGLIALTGWEKFRRGTRVEFLAGSRVLARFRQWRDALASTTRVLSVPPEELAGSIERLRGDVKTLQRTLRGFQERLAAHEAQALVARGAALGDRIVVAEALGGWDAAGLKALATTAAAAESRAVVALFSTTAPALAVLARGADAGIDVAATLRSLMARFGGKGGGKPDLAQGGGLNASAEELVSAVRDLLTT